jgi:hypothetical protein
MIVAGRKRTREKVNKKKLLDIVIIIEEIEAEESD